MAKHNNQKLKLLYLIKFLYEETNEMHQLTMSQIIQKLDQVGIKAERKSIYSDIELLRQFGFDVICEKNKLYGYYIGSRGFEEAELKILIDGIQSSKFITKKKSKELIKKVERLTDKYSANELRKQVWTDDSLKTLNESIYYNVDKIHNAIAEKKKVSFKYFEYTVDKNKRFRNDGHEYIVSPYALRFSDEKYYLIAHYPKNEKLTHFRVDRIAQIYMLKEKSTDIELVTDSKFNLCEYMKKTFDMYAGKTQKVQIKCKNNLINIVIDRFGQDVSIRKADDENFILSSNVNISPTFYSWIFTFGNEMKIISPDTVINEFREMTQNVLQNI